MLKILLLTLDTQPGSWNYPSLVIISCTYVIILLCTVVCVLVWQGPRVDNVVCVVLVSSPTEGENTKRLHDSRTEQSLSGVFSG